MKRLVWVLLACVALSAKAQTRLPEEITRALDAAGVPLASVAVVVQDASANAPRLSLNSTASMNPASVMKLVTTYTALGMLGPGFTWKTGMYTTGKLAADGVLDGDVIWVGSGDPKLTQERLWLMLRELRARGVRHIAGDVVLDRSLFDLSGAQPGRFDNQPLRAYNVVPDALLVHFKAIELRFVPQGDGVRVLAEPVLAGLSVESKLKPATQSCDNWREGLRYRLEPAGRLVFEGTYPSQCGEKTWSLGVWDHPEFVRGVFESLWAGLGGTLKGSVREGVLPSAAQLLASSESPALGELVRDVNKWSNNVMARQLMLTLGAAGGKRGVQEADGAAAVRGWLAAQHLAMPELVLENGAGLSRSERVSAIGLTQLLVAALKHPVMPEFLASLPIGGTDGTMQKRLKEPDIAGRARIKTGTLDGVRAAAGYVLDRQGRQQVVVMLVNHREANSPRVKDAEDALLRWVFAAGSP